MYSIYFENKGVEFINKACILRDPDIIKSLPSSISIKFFNFNKLVSNLDLDLFLINPYSQPSKCSNSTFAYRHHKHIVTGDLRIIRNNILKNLFIKGPKYREVRAINLEEVKR